MGSDYVYNENIAKGMGNGAWCKKNVFRLT
jgi:hypothetical protein